MVNRTDHIKGLTLAVIGVLILTPDALLVRLVSADEWSLLFWRGLFTALALVLYLAVRDRAIPIKAFRSVSRRGLLIGACYAFNTILFVVSIRNTSVANTLVILATSPLFAAIFSRLFLREHVPVRTWVTAILGIGCIALIMGDSVGSVSFLGDGAAVGIAVIQGTMFTLLRREGNVDTAPMLSVGAVIMALAVVPFAQPMSLVGWDWTFMLLLGGFIVPISFVLTTSAPKYIPAAEVSLTFLLETILGPIWVWMALGEIPPDLTVLGGAVLIAALAVHTVLGLKQERP